MSDWKPIESAPKDGTQVLITGGTAEVCDYQATFVGAVGIAFWDVTRDHWHGNEANAHDEFYVHKPTHWMPLPEPPK